MRIIVGLGNPGKEYIGTRHNVGFSVLDKILDVSNDAIKNEMKDFVSYSFIHKDEKIFLIYPQKFMNLSGEALRSFINYFKADFNDVLIIQDDMDLPVGKIKLKRKGSSGGHKGIQNIIDVFGTDEFQRLKIGIGKPTTNNSIDFVLGKPSNEEKKVFLDSIELAFDCVLDILNNGFDFAMNKYN